jgi:hypothetical protein
VFTIQEYNLYVNTETHIFKGGRKRKDHLLGNEYRYSNSRSPKKDFMPLTLTCKKQFGNLKNNSN